MLQGLSSRLIGPEKEEERRNEKIRHRKLARPNSVVRPFIEHISKRMNVTLQ